MRALYLSTGDAGRAEECAQEAFIRAWQRRDQLEGHDPVRWVTRVAFRLAVSDWRRGQRLMHALRRLTAQAPADAAPPPDDLVHVVEVLKQLSAAHRVVVVLHHFEDLSVDAIAELLSIPPGTVKSRLARGRAQIRHITIEEESHDRA